MITLWTDGSAEPNPGPGGYAVIEEDSDGFRPVRLGAENPSTNIRMEGTAIYEAMRYADELGEDCEIYTDSQFWVNVLEKWASGWEMRGWRKSGGSIKNLDLVKKTFVLYRKVKPELVWVRGHVGTAGNEVADKFANRAKKGLTVEKWEERRK